MPRYITKTKSGLTISIRGDLGPHCCDCADAADNLCDYPIGGDKTCDRLICHEHSNTVAKNMHYCDAHHEIWLKENKNFYPKIVIASKKKEPKNENKTPAF